MVELDRITICVSLKGNPMPELGAKITFLGEEWVVVHREADHDRRGDNACLTCRPKTSG